MADRKDFNPEDWVICTNELKNTYKYEDCDTHEIVETEFQPFHKVGDIYRLLTVDHWNGNVWMEDLDGKQRNTTYSVLKDHFKHWDITDAKKGDILFEKVTGMTFIFRGMGKRNIVRPKGQPNKIDVVEFYCFVSKGGNFVLQDYDNYICAYNYSKYDAETIKPADNEHRKRLEHICRTFGYEFDHNDGVMKVVVKQVAIDKSKIEVNKPETVDLKSKSSDIPQDKVDKFVKQIGILDSVAYKLVNGCLTSGNISHDGKTKGYTIRNVANNIRSILFGERHEHENDRELPEPTKALIVSKDDLDRMKYLAGVIYGDANSLTSGNVSHYRTAVMKFAEEIISIIDKNNGARE